MRKITPKERKNGMKYCTFCKPLRVAAIYRNQYTLADEKKQFSCAIHEHLLIDGVNTPDKQVKRGDSGRITEADNQTWERL